MGENTKTDTRRLKSVEQSFTIVEYLRERDGATLTEIADDLEMPVSTAHIHLSTLLDTGYVVKVDGEYDCSFRFLATGGEMRDTMALFQATKPEIDDLREQLGEHANLTVEENGYAVQLYKSESPDSVDDNAPLGRHLHLHSTATGKAILARLSEERLEAVLEKRGLPAVTENTVTDEDDLRDELRTIRDRGYSINRGEHYPGVCAVATSIVSEPDGVIGAISVSGPLSRMGTDRIEDELVPKLHNKQNIIELKIRQHQ
ncbi:IclR family transcriptional regulator [Natronolimnohabitans innermongolicus]|uniref:IclR family transcriptional regulator n=1 Tax=Natronolimnohabitans innermongolicus JCM 12255 TaxID=1227499 RepID=L9XC81_9EURY|nr:IclR family transcriptional regulator [Natronolimnohabitans innermongolicus]ELY59016.1 IclR family transcriptional regulator [Natronolimnohabitans innermongolicus JCM 12255]